MAQWQEKLIPLKTLTTGDVLHLHLFSITGSRPGPSIYLQSSMHASEIQGQGVLYHLLKYLKQHDFAGQIQVMALANPLAAQQQVLTHTLGRYNFLTGNNWNRNYLDLKDHLHFDFAAFAHQYLTAPKAQIVPAFKQAYLKALQDFLKNPYGIRDEQKLAVILQSYASQADIVIDLHNAWAGTHYLYATQDDATAQAWGIPYIIRMPYQFAGALDEASFMPWYHLAQAFAAEGTPLKFDFNSYTVELGSEANFSFAQSGQDLMLLLNYLAARGVVTFTPHLSSPIYESDLANFKTYYAPRTGLIDFLAAPGEMVTAQKVMAQYLTWPQITAPEIADFVGRPETVLALSDGVILNHANANQVQEGQELIQVLEKLRPIK